MKMKKNLYINLVILFSILLPSCSTQVILPGLCYNDRDGTHICPKDYEEEPVNRDMEELQPIYDECAEWESHSGEAWMQCIMNEERRRQLLERVKHTA
tara:strand:+ start:449 stop:742 length:294 start_codon:yes stop_codon:yes gene_type:complete